MWNKKETEQTRNAQRGGRETKASRTCGHGEGGAVWESLGHGGKNELYERGGSREDLDERERRRTSSSRREERPGRKRGKTRLKRDFGARRVAVCCLSSTMVGKGGSETRVRWPTKRERRRNRGGSERKRTRARRKQKPEKREGTKRRELCFPGLFLEGRCQDAAAPPIAAREPDFALLRFAAGCFLRGVAAAEKSPEKRPGRATGTAIGSALAFLRFS